MLFLLITTGLVLLVVGAVYQWSRAKYSYFQVRNIPYRKPKFPLGSICELRWVGHLINPHSVRSTVPRPLVVPPRAA